MSSLVADRRRRPQCFFPLYVWFCVGQCALKKSYHIRSFTANSSLLCIIASPVWSPIHFILVRQHNLSQLYFRLTAYGCASGRFHVFSRAWIL